MYFSGIGVRPIISTGSIRVGGGGGFGGGGSLTRVRKGKEARITRGK